MTVKEIVKLLKQNGSEHNRKGMARYGIKVDNAFGVSAPVIRSIAKEIGIKHELAKELWNCGVHEAHHIAALTADPKLTTKSMMNKWVRDLYSWDICDSTCSNLFRKTDYAIDMIFEWTDNKKEFVRRAGFSLIAFVAVHHKKRSDEEFLPFLALIVKHSNDERNMVKKAVNWALRQIGKRSMFLNREALDTAYQIKKFDSKSARWIASDAIRELTNEKIVARIKR